MNQLISLNLSAGVLHFVQFLYSCILTNTSFKNEGFFCINNNTKQLGCYRIGNVVSIFPLLASLNHFYCVSNSHKYFAYLKHGYNPVRWIEYSMSAGIMWFVIAQLSGVQDINLLLLLIGCNVLLQITGYSSENPEYGKFRKTINSLGFYLFIIMWIPIFTYFFTSLAEAEGNPPDSVYSIIFVMFALFAVFGVVNTLYVQKKIKKFEKVELAYIVLSFVSKTFLTNMTLFGGVSRRGNE